jgi:HIV Tat-specific factor 1
MAAASNGKSQAGKKQPGPLQKKSDAESVMEKHQERQKRARENAEAQAQWFELKENTSVYITGLPDDVTEAEIAQV